MFKSVFKLIKPEAAEFGSLHIIQNFPLISHPSVYDLKPKNKSTDSRAEDGGVTNKCINTGSN